ncbi:MAG: class flavin-dependent oxidoreductase [Chloroflexi bacterium]|nr:class flavin-dependent oxidoreductase [Chloroflexota bacterium]
MDGSSENSELLKLGVFLPVGNNGWMMTSTAPQFMPTWELNRDVSQLAEEIGFDYVFSMAKWRGLGGATKFWDFSIESITLMSALAAATKRLRLVCSIAPTIVHPAVFAKMAATLDGISGGRLDINIVSAGNHAEYSQMGLYPEDFEAHRYDYTEEWLTIVKALWTQPSVTFDGEYFSLDDCRSDPKPVQRPYPGIVCATNSERGFQFVADHCDEAFIGGAIDEVRASTQRLRELADERGRTVTTHRHINLIQADTDREAQELFEHYRDGADWEAIAQVHGPTRSRADVEEVRRRNLPRYIHYFTTAYPGGPETIANVVEEYAHSGISGLLLTFPDFLDGLRKFNENVMPILRSRGIIAPAPERSAARV